MLAFAHKRGRWLNLREDQGNYRELFARDTSVLLQQGEDLRRLSAVA